jgi:hypothetical protein
MSCAYTSIRKSHHQERPIDICHRQHAPERLRPSQPLHTCWTTRPKKRARTPAFTMWRGRPRPQRRDGRAPVLQCGAGASPPAACGQGDVFRGAEGLCRPPTQSQHTYWTTQRRNGRGRPFLQCGAGVPARREETGEDARFTMWRGGVPARGLWAEGNVFRGAKGLCRPPTQSQPQHTYRTTRPRASVIQCPTCTNRGYQTKKGCAHNILKAR